MGIEIYYILNICGQLGGSDERSLWGIHIPKWEYQLQEYHQQMGFQSDFNRRLKWVIVGFIANKDNF